MMRDDADERPGSRLGTGIGTMPLLALTAAVLMLAAALPILVPEIPPLGDYPNHLMRMHALAGLERDPVLSEFYRVDWGLVPNLVMDLVVPPLGLLMGVDAAFKLFAVAAFLVIVSGTAALYRAVWGRLDVGPLAAFLFLYTLSTYLGLFNYLFGIGLALWALAAWIMLRDRGPLVRGAVSAVMVPVLFLTHLFGLGLYGLALLAYEGVRLAEDRRDPLESVAAFALPFAPVILLLAASPSAEFVADTLWVGSAKLMGFDWLFGAYSPMVGWVTGLSVAAGVAWGLWSRSLRVHRVGWAFLGLGLLVYLAMPLVLFGSWFADSRLPVGVALVLLGFCRWEMPTAAGRAAFVAAVASLALLRVVDVGAAFARVEPMLADLRASASVIERGSVVLVSYADESLRNGTPFRPVQYTDDRAVAIGLIHMPVWAAMTRSSFVSTAFTHPGKQVLQVTEPYKDLDGSYSAMPKVSHLTAALENPWSQADKYWVTWPTRYDYVFVLYTEPGMGNPSPKHLTLAHEGPHYRIYRVKR